MKELPLPSGSLEISLAVSKQFALPISLDPKAGSSVINGINNEGVGCLELTTIAIRDGVGEMDLAVGIGVRW